VSGYLSDGDGSLLLGSALRPYLRRGWTIDDRVEYRAVISKKWSARYRLAPFIALTPLPNGRALKRRAVTIHRSGAVRVERMPSRGEQSHRYERA
jgi:hypothetical protein